MNITTMAIERLKIMNLQFTAHLVFENPCIYVSFFETFFGKYKTWLLVRHFEIILVLIVFLVPAYYETFLK